MRKAKSRTKAIWARRLLVCAIGLLISTLFLQWAFNKSEPLILPLAQQKFCDMITETVYSATKDIEFDKVLVANYTKEGKLSHMHTDTLSVNACVTHILNEIDNKLGEADVQLAIPIGDIVGDALSLGQGPDILVELNQYKSTRAEIKSSFVSAGINHTLHRLTLELEVEAVVLLPGLNAEKVLAVLSLPISETVIVGETPQTYINNDK